MQLTAFQVHLRESVRARASSTIQQHRWLSQHALRWLKNAWMHGSEKHVLACVMLHSDNVKRKR